MQELFFRNKPFLKLVSLFSFNFKTSTSYKLLESNFQDKQIQPGKNHTKWYIYAQAYIEHFMLHSTKLLMNIITCKA